MTSTKPVIMIVPGGFCSPQTYEHVEQLLHQQGYETIVLKLTVCGDLSSKTAASREWRDMAEKGVADDVKLIHSLLLPLLDQGRKAVIVAHSYGSVPAMLSIEGQTVAERAERNSIGGIIAYVNVAGFAHPARGKNVFGTDDEPPLMPYHVLEVSTLFISIAKMKNAVLCLTRSRKGFYILARRPNHSSLATSHPRPKTLRGRRLTKHRAARAS